ncbi:MAG: endolytic transglycosylase MltG [Candidatus Peribacteraceae bacterium]
MKKLIKLALWILVLFSVWFWWSLRPVGEFDSPAAVSIESGDSFATVTEKLATQNILRSALIFQLYGRVVGATTSIKPGTYSFTGNESVSTILDMIKNGRVRVTKVTIPEGLTVAQIDELMASKGLGKPGDIIHCAFTCDFSSFDFLPTKHFGTESQGYGSRLEGFLFPETYAISEEEYVPKFFLEQMLGEFRRRIITKLEQQIRSSGRTLSDVINMASLIEEESRKDDERAVISGILWKRLENRVVLGVDATTRYELMKPTQPLTKVELESDHAYNTRRTQGLPPTPIANPGEASVKAALTPTSSDFWYYLHGKDGQIRYAKTNDEHNQNKYQYLK